MMQDLRLSLRVLLAKPGYTAILVLSLALEHRYQHDVVRDNQHNTVSAAALLRPRRIGKSA